MENKQEEGDVYVYEEDIVGRYSHNCYQQVCWKCMIDPKNITSSHFFKSVRTIRSLLQMLKRAQDYKQTFNFSWLQPSLINTHTRLFRIACFIINHTSITLSFSFLNFLNTDDIEHLPNLIINKLGAKRILKHVMLSNKKCNRIRRMNRFIALPQFDVTMLEIPQDSDVTIVRWLLEDCKVDANGSDSVLGSNPRAEVIKLYIKYGGDINIAANRNNYESCYELLFEAGAIVNPRIAPFFDNSKIKYILQNKLLADFSHFDATAKRRLSKIDPNISFIKKEEKTTLKHLYISANSNNLTNFYADFEQLSSSQIEQIDVLQLPCWKTQQHAIINGALFIHHLSNLHRNVLHGPKLTQEKVISLMVSESFPAFSKKISGLIGEYADYFHTFN